ncbi:MAG: alpha/beta hydrolase [Verrucomicrobiales bacterium]|nr:alpha/beta hydrolase [Verrucomicrobiales bacterium]
MRVLCIAVLTLSLPMISLGKGKIEKKSYFYDKAQKDIEYAVYIPSAYDGKRQAPLVVILHGLGSNPHQVIRYSGVVKEAEKRGYIVVAPYGYNERGWYGSRGRGKEGFLFGEQGDPDNLGELSEGDVFNVMDIVRKEYRIDASRIYLMGHSMGGGGTLYLGGKYPDLWAGLAPMAPAVFFDSSILKKMRKLPVYIVAGENDLLVPVGSVRRWARQMDELEMDYHYNEIKGGDHNQSFANNPEMISEIYDFFDKREKSRSKLTAPRELRVFTNRKGIEIKASVESVASDKATIIREDGKKFILPISMLSDEDAQFLKKWSESNGRGE